MTVPKTVAMWGAQLRGVTTALEKVRTELGVEPGDTVAVGDSENDVEMLGWAAHGWAMGHAPPFVIAGADYVTGTLDDDGAATVLRSLLG